MHPPLTSSVPPSSFRPTLHFPALRPARFVPMRATSKGGKKLIAQFSPSFPFNPVRFSPSLKFLTFPFHRCTFGDRVRESERRGNTEREKYFHLNFGVFPTANTRAQWSGKGVGAIENCIFIRCMGRYADKKAKELSKRNKRPSGV